jgi:anti-anti-sigma factor
MTQRDAKRHAPPARVLAEPAVEVAFHRLGVAIVTVRGEHDSGGVQALRDALTAAGPQLNVIVDLTECTAIDPAVAGAVVDAGDELAGRGGSLALVVPPKATAVQRVVKLSGLADAVAVYASRGGAIASVRHTEHVIQIRDLRLRFGDPDLHAAECSCGWRGEAHTGRTAERSARREATLHVDGERGA